jgi:glutamate decarboxylase
LITKGDGLRVFAFKLRDQIENYTVFDFSSALRERGWQIPACTFRKNREDLAALRVVFRRGFTRALADVLAGDLERQLAGWRSSRHRSTIRRPPQVSITSEESKGV